MKRLPGADISPVTVGALSMIFISKEIWSCCQTVLDVTWFSNQDFGLLFPDFSNRVLKIIKSQITVGSTF